MVTPAGVSFTLMASAIHVLTTVFQWEYPILLPSIRKPNSYPNRQVKSMAKPPALGWPYVIFPVIG